MKITKLLFIAFAAVMTAAGATVAVVDDGGGVGANHANYDLAGYQFTNAGDISVTELGIWENGGLAQDHQVGIYDLSGNLQVSAIVTSSTVADGQGYGYVLLDLPHTLTAGTWFIGAYYNQGSLDYMRDFGNPPVMAPGLTFQHAAVYYSGTSFNPSTPAGQNIYVDPTSTRGSYFGPNFQFNDASAPEPGTLSVLVVGLGIVGRRLARRNRS